MRVEVTPVAGSPARLSNEFTCMSQYAFAGSSLW